MFKQLEQNKPLKLDHPLIWSYILHNNTIMTITKPLSNKRNPQINCALSRFEEDLLPNNETYKVKSNRTNRQIFRQFLPDQFSFQILFLSAGCDF